MTKGQKNKLHFAAKAIEKGYENGTILLGAPTHDHVAVHTKVDRHGRDYPSAVLAKRAGTRVFSQRQAHDAVRTSYGLSDAQSLKLDRVAASTHNLKQRAERVARFLTRVAADPSYVGASRSEKTGAVRASL